MKKFLALVLCVLMVASLIPMTVAAEEGEELKEMKVYENNFENSTRVVEDEKTVISSSSNVKYNSNGVVEIVGSSKSPYSNSTWTRTFDISQTQNGKVKFEIRMISSATKGGNAITLNGVCVVKTSSSGGNPVLQLVGTSTQNVAMSSAYGQSFEHGVLITIEYDTVTGDVVISSDQNGAVNSVKGNVGVPATEGQVALKVGNGGNRATFYFDDVRLYVYVPAGVEGVVTYPVTTTVEGNMVDYKLIEEGAAYTLPEAAEKDGYKFLGWTDGVELYAAGAEVAIFAETFFEPVFTLKDSAKRENYRYYTQDFENEPSGDRAVVFSTPSAVENGALKVLPGETNTWSNGSGEYPTNSVNSLSFKLDTALEVGEEIHLVHDRSERTYWVRIIGTEEGAILAAYEQNTGVEIKVGEWYDITLVMTTETVEEEEKGITKVYCDGAYVGKVMKSWAGEGNKYRLFNIKNESQATFSVDNINLTTKADASFIKVDGYQKTAVENGVYNVRFVAVLGEIFDGETEVGFEVTAPAFEKTWAFSADTVYESVTANFGTESVAAADRGGKYVTAAAITEIPESAEVVEFVVTPYVVLDGVKIYGSSVTVTVNPLDQ